MHERTALLRQLKRDRFWKTRDIALATGRDAMTVRHWLSPKSPRIIPEAMLQQLLESPEDEPISTVWPDVKANGEPAFTVDNLVEIWVQAASAGVYREEFPFDQELRKIKTDGTDEYHDKACILSASHRAGLSIDIGTFEVLWPLVVSIVNTMSRAEVRARVELSMQRYRNSRIRG